jgi:ribosome assembly protein YihI (activator of Der GTPase)
MAICHAPEPRGLLFRLPEIGLPDRQQDRRYEMATNLRDGKTAKKPEGTHGGNRGGDQSKKDEQSKRSSQAAGKDPHRGRN